MNKKKWSVLSNFTWDNLKSYTWDYTSLEWALSDNLAVFDAQGVRLEQSSMVFATGTEMIANVVVSRRDYKSAMLSYLPVYEKNSKIFNALLGAYGNEFRALEQDLDIVDRNMSLDTSIESLHINERDLGIRNVKGLGYDQRREQISSRYRSSFDQTTEETIKSVASAYGNGEVDVSKTLIPGIYEIKFVGIGIPNNLSGLKEALDIVIPAHLDIDYIFTFTPWMDLRTKAWGQVKAKTWNELREWEGVV